MGIQSENAKTKRRRLSPRNLVLATVAIAVLAVATVLLSGYLLNQPPEQTSIVFDFDTGSPSLIEGQNTPLSQTSNELTAIFSSPSDSTTPAFSIQSYETTFMVLSKFSGRWLYDNKPSADVLDIFFSQSLTSINLTFATLEYHGGPTTEPTEIKLTAYMNSTDNSPVGTTVARGTFSAGLYPQGSLYFTSNEQTFNLVRIEIPYVPNGATDFFVDNITVAHVQRG